MKPGKYTFKPLQSHEIEVWWNGNHYVAMPEAGGECGMGDTVEKALYTLLLPRLKPTTDEANKADMPTRSP